MAEPGLALCSMATSQSASAAGSFALSVQTFERGRHLFLGADAEGAAAVHAAWTLPLAQLHVVDVPAQFHNRDRERSCSARRARRSRRSRRCSRRRRRRCSHCLQA